MLAPRRPLGFCKNAPSDKIDKASLNPAISAVRLLAFSSYVSALTMHMSPNLARYCTTADNSAFAESLSLVNSPDDLFKLALSSCLYLTSCSFVTFVTLFSCVNFWYEDSDSDSVIPTTTDHHQPPPTTTNH